MGRQNSELRRDIRQSGALLGELIEKTEGRVFYQKIEQIRTLAKRARHGDVRAERRLKLILRKTQKPAMVAKAFCEFLRLSNTAEDVQRIRLLKQGAVGLENRLVGLLPRLIRKNGKQRVVQLLNDLKIDLVLTAHPTEAMPPLVRRARQILAPGLLHQNSEAINRSLEILWNVPAVRGEGPSPLDEAQSGFLVVEHSLWKTLPRALKETEKILEFSMAADWSPFLFSSWMGGDRDGNPFVTAQMTEEIRGKGREIARRLFCSELDVMKEELNFSKASVNFRKRLKLRSGQPYRELMDRWISQLATDDLAEADFMRELQDLRKELMEQGWAYLAQGGVVDLIRRLKTFGLDLLRMDIRQSSDIHETIVDQISAKKGFRYRDLSEEERIRFLKMPVGSVGQSGRSLKGAEAKEFLRLAKVIQQDPHESLNCYIISMTESASDLLEVQWLQKVGGVKTPLPVVPLFETPEALDQAAQILTRYWQSLPAGRRPSEQQIMIGYSDSTKREGFLAASWQLHETQRKLEKVSRKFGIPIFFFHGRGGSIGRGGGPLRQTLRALPAESRTSKIRITIQGETIETDFGWNESALRSFELYLLGMTELRSGLLHRKIPAAWTEVMDQMAQACRSSFKNFLTKDPHFIQYFREITPVDFIGDLRIGSRPSRRKKKADLDSLRAIPWVFSWTQNRGLLASWMGSEAGLRWALVNSDQKILKKMYASWPYFRATLHLLSIAAAKADMKTFLKYSELVKPSLNGMTNEIVSLHDELSEQLKEVMSVGSVLKNQPELAKAIVIRTPYVDVLNQLQIFALEKIRNREDVAEMKEVLALTMSGIAAGMRNTG